MIGEAKPDTINGEEVPPNAPADLGLVPLQSILCTEELETRPLRPADHEAENRALKSLVQALADSPGTILQTLADTILRVFNADSAGLSLLTQDGKRFYWPAIAGGWQPHIGGGTPREFGPCGDVLDCNAPLLFKNWERRYPYLVAATPPANEGLLVPFYVEGKAVGTIWAIAHSEHRKFDAEDLRQLESLGQFASSAYQAVASQEALARSKSEVAQGTVRADQAEASRELAETLVGQLRDGIQQREQAEQQARASEVRFRTLFHLGPVGIYSIGATGLIEESNAVAAKLWGRGPQRGDPRDRYCGSYKAFFPDGTPMAHEETPMVAVLSGELPEVRDAEFILGRPDGTRVTVIANIVPLRNDRGEITGAINWFYDITERKQAEAAQSKLVAIVESSDDAIISKDLNGTIASWNRGAEQLFGYTAQETVGQSVTMLIPPERADEEPALLERIRRGESVDHYETVRRRKDGSLLDISLTLSPIRNKAGDVTGASKIARDITSQKRNEGALRQSEERYRTLFNVSSVAVYSIDSAGVIQNFNLRAAELWGQSPAVGATDKLFCGSHRLYLPDGTYLPHDRCPMATVASGEIAEALDTEVLIERPDGSRVTVIVNVRPLKNDRGEITGAINCFYDITERKKAEKHAGMLANLSRDLADANEEADIVKIAVSAVGRHLDGHRCYFVECLENQDRLIVSSDYVRDDAPSLAGEMRRFNFGRRDPGHEFSSGNFQVEDVATHPLTRDHRESYAAVGVGSYAIQPFRRDGAWAACLVITEKTARTWTADDLRTLEEVVARVWPKIERARLVHDLGRARDVAERANVTKDMFLASLSHELRTPLSPVLLLAGEAIDDPATSAASREIFRTIEKNIKLEARLIDDLLDVTRVAYGKLVLDLQPVDLHLVIGDAIETVRTELRDKNIVLSLELTALRPCLRGDPVRLQQVFWNLLRNAGKFSPSGGEITVTSLILPDGLLRITVADEGVGMTTDELARLFTSFSQGDHAAGGGSHRFGGLGLGLAISRTLVESHGGTIRAESEGLDLGSTFIVEFPLDTVGRMEPAAAASPAPATRTPFTSAGTPHRRILLVEDHPSTRIAMTHLLERRDYKVVAAGSLAEARAAADRTPFDLVISDLGLPDGSGNELMAELGARFGLKGIALTGYGNEEDMVRSREAGFIVHLTKPISIARLETALATVATA